MTDAKQVKIPFGGPKSWISSYTAFPPKTNRETAPVLSLNLLDNLHRHAHPFIFKKRRLMDKKRSSLETVAKIAVMPSSGQRPVKHHSRYSISPSVLFHLACMKDSVQAKPQHDRQANSISDREQC